MSAIKLYDTYRKVKGVFVKPKLKVYFGLWKNDPNLPIWRRGLFHIFNYDMCCKEKYNEWRYEFPPQFTIVFLGLSFSITLHCPINNNYTCDDHYWECILEYLYGCGNYNITDTLINCGYWKNSNDNKYFQLRKEYLKSKYHREYETARLNYCISNKTFIV